MRGLIDSRVCVALVILLLSSGISWSEPKRIWDPDLKKFITEEDIGKEEVYLTEEQALKLIFPHSDRIRREEIRLTPKEKDRIEKRLGWHFPEEVFPVHVGETAGKIDGYAIIQNTIGKYRPITYIVGVTPAGKVSGVEVLVYRESRGSEVRKKRFNHQYLGKTAQDPIRINRDIINITGATMSVRSVNAGVKRALVLVEEFYLAKKALDSLPGGTGREAEEGKVEKGFLERLLGR